MQLIKKPVTGMKDILPQEMAIREYVLEVMRKTYHSFGFVSIETPAVEHLENLNSKQGGENEKLIFKILKRGEKLNLETAKEEADLVDGGLRYDLTVPLCRYYSNHANELPMPFKALQTGNVWRADRPQRGRYRQFRQCDIDIIGDESPLAEIELILATSAFLGKIGFSDFTIRINDRRLLKAMAAGCGFAEEKYDTLFIILDKMDKIGMDGVAEELEKEGFDSQSVARYLDMFRNITPDGEGILYLKDLLKEQLDPMVADQLIHIMESVDSCKAADFKLVFDPTLVRGMGYYTGPIFEIGMDQYGGSVGGGGRYDEMIGKFTGNKIPAVGFSVGFERIVMLLLENGYKVPGAPEKKAYLLDKKLSKEAVEEVLKKAMAERAGGKEVNIAVMKKNKKFQKDQLEAGGFTDIEEVFAD
ncbi:MAG: histidine--tRNA ligase [Lachnospiraceae bacterium]|nr:histidine--tRNA ligase [Lachnospiraceae bacterium]